MGAQLTEDYAGKRPLVIGVLKGVIFFMTDLLREMDLMADLDFIDVSSYHGGTASTGEVTLEQDISTDIKDRDVIIVEDILDSGRTLAYLKDFLEARQPRSFKVCTLLDKPRDAWSKPGQITLVSMSQMSFSWVMVWTIKNSIETCRTWAF